MWKVNANTEAAYYCSFECMAKVIGMKAAIKADQEKSARLARVSTGRS